MSVRDKHLRRGFSQKLPLDVRKGSFLDNFVVEINLLWPFSLQDAAFSR